MVNVNPVSFAVELTPDAGTDRRPQLLAAPAGFTDCFDEPRICAFLGFMISPYRQSDSGRH